MQPDTERSDQQDPKRRGYIKKSQERRVTYPDRRQFERPPEPDPVAGGKAVPPPKPGKWHSAIRQFLAEREKERAKERERDECGRDRRIITLQPGERREVMLPWVRMRETGRLVGLVVDPLLDPRDFEVVPRRNRHIKSAHYRNRE